MKPTEKRKNFYFRFGYYGYNRGVIGLREQAMTKENGIYWVLAGLAAALALGGCVERELTINTNPQGGLVVLNDEEIGEAPVTVSFQWYGDYNVRITREGYEPLRTHRELKGPWYDCFPFDFLAQNLTPKRIIDSYEWTFDLEPRQEVNRQELIQKAEALKSEL